MNRAEFLQRLEQALRGLPEEERRRAMEYYENYFEEAGSENEAQVLGTLGTPEEAAEDILREFRDVSAVNGRGRRGFRGMAGGFRTMDAGQKLLALVLICAALAVAVPVCAAVIGGVGGVLLGLLAALACVLLIAPVLSLAAWASAFGIAVGMIYYAVTRFEPAGFLLLLGLVLVFAALGILFWHLTIYLFRTTYPAIFRGLVNALRGLFDRLRGNMGGTA